MSKKPPASKELSLQKTTQRKPRVKKTAAPVPPSRGEAEGAAAAALDGNEKQVPRVARDDSGESPSRADTPRPLFQLTMPVRWRDLDAFNHVNNSIFLTYLEETRLQWMQSLPDWLTDDSAPLLAAANINFRRPIEYPETLVIELFAERVGNTSVTLGHRITSARDASIIYADGNTVMVWIDRRNGRPAALPEAVRAACV